MKPWGHRGHQNSATNVIPYYIQLTSESTTEELTVPGWTGCMSLSFTLNHDCLSQQQHLFRSDSCWISPRYSVFLGSSFILDKCKCNKRKGKHNHDLCLAIYTMTSMYIYSTAIRFYELEHLAGKKNTSSCYSANAVSMDLIIIGEFFFLYEECSAPWPSILRIPGHP